MLTILYYTANRENPQFEQKIISNLRNVSGGLPIVSVSQKPLNLGKNICVGNVGHSYLNEFRQILLGAKEAKSKYLIFAEADFLYPRQYFNFSPQGADLYRYDNVWIVFNRRICPRYCRKNYSNGAQIVKREFAIRELEIYLKDQPEWADGDFRVQLPDGRIKEDCWNSAKPGYFGSEIPCITFKTGGGLRASSASLRGEENEKQTLPYWGNIELLREKYL